jgi:erythromycin esterase-like protein
MAVPAQQPAQAQQAAQPSPAVPLLSPTLAAFISRHTYPMTFVDGEVSGSGAELLMREAASTQFFMLAEYVSHIDHATPLFMAAFFEKLQRAHGFDYVAVEQDPFGTQSVSTRPHRGNISGIAEQARRFPYAFTFVNDEELRMFAAVGGASRGRWRPVWGVDQVFGATLPLEELRRLAPTPAALAAVDALLSEARRREIRVVDFGDWRGTRNPEHHYVAGEAVANVERFAHLRRLFSPRSGSRADELLRGLELSSQIYSYNNRAAELSPTGEPLGYYSNFIREQLMKEKFLENYRQAQRLDRRLPRVVVKAGANHLVRGRNFTNVHTLGNMLHEFALTNRMQALTIVMLPVRPEWPNYEAMPGELQTLLQSRDLSATTLVDLRPLRPHLHGGETFGLQGAPLRDLRFLAYGMDFALFLPSRNGSFSLTAPDIAPPQRP